MCVCGTRDEIQGLVLARQALYHLSHTPSLFFVLLMVIASQEIVLHLALGQVPVGPTGTGRGRAIFIGVSIQRECS
jgi:hypothetical protein